MTIFLKFKIRNLLVLGRSLFSFQLIVCQSIKNIKTINKFITLLTKKNGANFSTPYLYFLFIQFFRELTTMHYELSTISVVTSSLSPQIYQFVIYRNRHRFVNSVIEIDNILSC